MTACGRSATWSLPQMLDTWLRTVLRLSTSASAISWFGLSTRDQPQDLDLPLDKLRARKQFDRHGGALGRSLHERPHEWYDQFLNAGGILGLRKMCAARRDAAHWR